jgi:hypothetical protein
MRGEWVFKKSFKKVPFVPKSWRKKVKKVKYKIGLTGVDYRCQNLLVVYRLILSSKPGPSGTHMAFLSYRALPGVEWLSRGI